MTIRLQPVKLGEPGAIWAPGTIMATKAEEKYVGKFSRYMAGILSWELKKAIDTQRYIYNNYKNWEP